jgi:amino acid adenylation domain-containing protein
MPASPQPENDALAARLAALSPERRAVVERLLRERGTVPRGARDGLMALSFGQQRLWFMAQLDPVSPVYNTVTSVPLPDRGVDLDALQWAVDAMVERHESLRTTFVAIDGEPFARLNPDTRVAVELDAPPTALARRPFDLERGPLLRVCVLRSQKLLVVCMHHIITDAWSMTIFLQELWLLHAARARGEAVMLPPLPISYADYAVWQRRELSGSRLQVLLEFWCAELAGLPVLDLATDRPRPLVPTLQGGSVPVHIPEEVTAGLRLLAREQGATLFMAVLAAFSLLLSRYTGQDCVVVGSPVAGRTRSELEGLIGFFVNTIVLRCDLRGEPSFRELLARIKQTAIRAYTHQDLPFEKLVEDLQPERDLSRNPLHQVMFRLEKTASVAAPDMPVTVAAPATFSAPGMPGIVEKETSIFDLSLDLWDGLGGLSGKLEYSKELFEQATVERLVGHFEVLLEGLIAQPDAPAHLIPLMSVSEREQLDAFNATTAPVPNQCVHELIDAQSIRTPDAPAVGGLKYRDLVQAANGVAQHLISCGAGPDTLIGVSLTRGPALVIALLGILKAGAAYLPLDPDDPPARLDQIIADASPLLVLTDAGTLPPPRPDLPLPLGDPASLAYAIYTSGSAGAPKAVLVEHRSLTNHCIAFAREARLSEADRVLQFASPSFDVAAEEIFPTLIAGGTVIPRSGHRVPSVTDLIAQIENDQVTVVNVPSGYWHEWVEAMENGSARVPASLRLVIIGSERVEPTRVSSWHRQVGHRPALLHAYGVSEATITSLVHWTEDDTVVLGFPLANVEAVVAGRHGEPLPIGVPGELWLAGAGLARGYLRRPALTAERFVRRQGRRFYRSGDRVRRRADGALEFLGRLDQQLKLGGLRIEPGEIEGQLRGHPGVKAAAVVLREGQLVAYVAGAAAPEALREHLRARLPAWMVPSHFELLVALPRTANGKLDRRALPAPSAPARRGRAPVGRLERQIAAVWREVLGVAEVGVHDTFFDLGGQSLLLVRVQARLAKGLNREIPILELFRRPTIHALATYLSQESS